MSQSDFLISLVGRRVLLLSVRRQVMEPKTWEKSEIIALIEAEIRACRQSANPVDREPPNMAETILSVLNEAGLIQDTP